MVLLLALYNTSKAMETAITYLTTLIISVRSDVRVWQSINTHTYIQAPGVLHTWMHMCYLSQTPSGYKNKRNEYQSLLMEDFHSVFAPE